MNRFVPSVLSLTFLATLTACGGGASDCETEWTERIESPTIWGETCRTILLNNSILVRDELTILPGTTVKVGDGFSITVDEQGMLTADGTEEDPIVFEGQNETAGAWGSIAFGTMASGNVLRNVHVAHACGNGFQFNPHGVVVQGTSQSQGAVHLENLNIRACDGVGLKVYEGGSIDGATNIRFDEVNEFPVEIAFTEAHQVDPSFAFDQGLPKPAIHVTRGRLGTTARWPAMQIPYQVAPSGDVWDNGFLTIEAGAVVEFEQDATLHSNKGKLNIAGTAEMPVILRGVEEFPGYWGGLAFQSLSTDNAMEFATIDYAGGNNFQGNEFAVVVTGDGQGAGAVTMTDVTISHSKGGGVVVFQGGSATLTRVQYDTNGGVDVDDRNP